MPRLTPAFVACGIGCLLFGSQVGARLGGSPQAPQTSAPIQQPPAPTPSDTPPQAIFREGIDVIRLDVSVIDKERRPVRGLTADDFTVFEEGKPQRVVAVTEIVATENDPSPTAWMRHVPRDVAANDLSDLVGDGKVYALVMDDVNVPWTDTDVVMEARATGRYFIDSLGASDVAAVVLPQDAGRSQDFTDDRGKLLAALDRYEPHERSWESTAPTPRGPGQGGADMPQRFSPVLMRSQCQRSQPTVPTLSVLAARMATIPNRRKTIVLVSTGVPVSFGASDGCSKQLADEMREVFRIAQRANINIYTVDPSGYGGHSPTSTIGMLRSRTPGAGTPSDMGLRPPGAAGGAGGMGSPRGDFMKIVAENTGAVAILNTDDLEGAIDRMFEEDASYYLVGYQTSNGKPDGKFRKVQVRVRNNKDASVRTRAGYYAPRADTLQTEELRHTPATVDLGLTGLMAPPGVALRATAVSIGLAGGPGPGGGAKDLDVGVILTVKLPAPREPLTELLTVTRNLYDPEGRAGPLTQDKWPMTLTPVAGDDLRYDVFYRLTLPPGRYQLRLNAHSTALDKSGSVFPDLDVPDLTRAPITFAGIMLGTTPAEGQPRTDALADLVPIIPTSARDFAANERVWAHVRVYQGGTVPIAPLSLRVTVMDVNDVTRFETTKVIDANAFDARRGAPFQIALPLERLAHGPHLLSLTAERVGQAPVRRDLLFRVR